MPEVQPRKAEKAIDHQRPFLGLRSFEEKNKSQFGGRDEEIKELYGLDENSVLTVIFGKSGIGKTSLIKAGLIPELRQNFYFPIYIRIDYSSTRTPLEQVRKIVFEEMKKKDSGVPEIGGTTLWEYFHNVNLLDDLVTPVLILDQFEEIFTLGEGKENVLELLIQLADLAENRIPLSVQSEYQKLNKTVPTHYAEQPYRVILSLREDYLARLEELKKYMPSIMNSRFRVVQMTVEQALEAAIKPGKGLIDKRVALEIIKKLPGISLKDFDYLDQKGSGQKNLKIEPFLLSLVCDRINEKRIEKGLKKITVDLVSKFNVTDIIYSFYTETITPYGENVEQAIEDCLLTEGGFRKLQALEEFQRLYDISDEVVDQLVDARILRKEIRDGVDYVELIHDVLAPIIKGKRSKRARRAREEERRAEIILTKKRQRAKLIRIASIVGLGIAMVLATMGYFAIKNSNDKEQIQNYYEKIAMTRNLIMQSKIVGSVDKETMKAAHLSRLAYLIHDQNESVIKEKEVEVAHLYNAWYMADYYNAMYIAIKNHNPSYFLENNYERFFQSIFPTKDNKRYIGLLGDGTLHAMHPDAFVIDSSSKLHKFEYESVSSIDIYQEDGRNLLAVAGTFDSIVIFDLETSNIHKKITIPEADQSTKSLAFMDDGSIILLQKNVMFRWNSTYNDVAKFSFVKDNTITALVYDSIKDSLIVGNERGDVFTMSIDNGGTKMNDALMHTSAITDIAYSHNGKWVATAGHDNTIVIWDSKNWNALPIRTNTALGSDLGSPLSVSFSADNDYVFVGYEKGTVLKWPVSLDILQQLICNEVKGNLNQDEWEDFIDVSMELNKTDYECR